MPFTQHSGPHAVQLHWVAGKHAPAEQQPSAQSGWVTQAPVLGLHESLVHASESLQTFTPRVQRWVFWLQLSLVQAELSSQSALLVQHSAMRVNLQRPASQVSLVQATPSLQSPGLTQQLAILVFLHRPPASHVSVVQEFWSSHMAWVLQQAERGV